MQLAVQDPKQKTLKGIKVSICGFRLYFLVISVIC